MTMSSALSMSMLIFVPTSLGLRPSSRAIDFAFEKVFPSRNPFFQIAQYLCLVVVRARHLNLSCKVTAFAIYTLLLGRFRAFLRLLHLYKLAALCVVRQKVLPLLEWHGIDPKLGANETRKLLCKPVARVDHFRVTSVNEA